MKTLLTMITFLAFCAFCSCQTDVSNMDENKTINLDEKSAQLIEADNTFGLELFQKIREEREKENIMISPLSISVAFAMAYNGADKDTKTEMEKAMKLNGLTTEQINNSYKMLIKALQSLDEKVAFEIANAIFYADGFTVKPDFLNINKTVYDAEVEKLNFNSQAAVDRINDWVSEKTNDKITKIIENLSPLDRMVLLNAIYFNGIWTNKFDEKGTHNLSFTKTNGTVIEVPMMQKEEKLDYTTNSLFSAVKMPYGNGQYNMVVMLPVTGKNSPNVIDALSFSNWKKWMTEFETKNPVVVTMPRFKFAFETELKNVLKGMGMIKAFQPNIADFSKISETDLYISSAVHKSFIDVNENGTEAAAVTSITFTTTSAGNEPPKTIFYVDKPFVFAITEKDTDAILFIGEVNHPEYE
ncbi:MAG: serpin family protein [Bacteroidetes bacterium]|nr:MAG: serpin family protein [Bacteroidota bacterium]